MAAEMKRSTQGVTINGSCRVVRQPFFVTALGDVGSRIEAGDVVRIDPDVRPGAGKIVLVGKSLQVHAQKPPRGRILGVAVAVQRDLLQHDGMAKAAA